MDVLEAVAERIKESRYLVAFTGAGISKESGIPTFRGKDGLWAKYDPEELASWRGFLKNPKLVWEWYTWRMDLIGKAKPNPAHLGLAKLEKVGILKAVITQNVDGLHKKAGNKRVLELHGNIWRVKCVSCDFKDRVKEPLKEVPPKCPKCGSLLRPDVVWFGEPLPKDVWTEAVMEAMKSDVLLVIGTSGLVAPASMIPTMAHQRGSSIVEINPEDTPISSMAEIKVRSPAGSFFKELIERLRI